MTLKETLKLALAYRPAGLIEASSPVLADELLRRAKDGEPLARKVILSTARALKRRPQRRSK